MPDKPSRLRANAWPAERIAQLRALHAARPPLTHGEIAERLRVSRAAVQNRCVRLRLKRLDRPGFSTPADYGYGFTPGNDGQGTAP